MREKPWNQPGTRSFSKCFLQLAETPQVCNFVCLNVSPQWLATTPEVRRMPSACLLRKEKRRKLGGSCPFSLFFLETEDLPGRRGWWLGKKREAGWWLGTYGKEERCRKAVMRSSCGGLMGRKPMGYGGEKEFVNKKGVKGKRGKSAIVSSQMASISLGIFQP